MPGQGPELSRQVPPAIEFQQVTKVFPDGTRAVDGFSLVAPAGRITVLVGLSGCGKTTLLRMVNRLVNPSSGAILLGNRNVTSTDAVQLRRRIGYVMQNSGLLPHRKVIDNICVVPRLLGVPRKQARAEGLALMDRVGLDREMAQRYPGQLSGGQQQRTGVARALAADPAVMLMDEPFGAVDPIVRTGLQRDLLRLQAERPRTILFVTHDMSEAFALGDLIMLLSKGATIVQSGKPVDFLTHPADDYVSRFIGLDNGAGSLHTTVVDGVPIVVDANSRPVGRFDDHPATPGSGNHDSDGGPADGLGDSS
ncbi:ABC transporter ATP-binding protein [Propionibacterium sp.]|uniref:ABC transporter ATP-binding protein n=1 Tax=Propionibacterium sp. TaxID=1977903 RepID=UPI0039E9E395